MKRERNNDSSNFQNIIAKQTQITGDITSDGDIRVDGIIEGNIKTLGKVVVGNEGKITGTLECENAYFEGFFSGKMNIKSLLTLKSTAKIEGDITTEKLSVEPGAGFNVTCAMKSTSKEATNAKSPKKPLNKFVRFTSIGLQMGLTIYLGSKLGEWLDVKFNNTDQLYYKIISLLAVFLAIASVIYQVVKITNEDESK